VWTCAGDESSKCPGGSAKTTNTVSASTMRHDWHAPSRDSSGRVSTLNATISGNLMAPPRPCRHRWRQHLATWEPTSTTNDLPRFVSPMIPQRSHTSYRIPRLSHLLCLVRNHLGPRDPMAPCPAHRHAQCGLARWQFHSRAQPQHGHQAGGDLVVERGQSHVARKRDRMQRHVVTLRGKEMLGIRESIV